MSEPEPKTDTLLVRVTPSTKRQFNEAAERFGMLPSEVLRELVTGFLEGRVKVSPPSNKEPFYNA